MRWWANSSSSRGYEGHRAERPRPAAEGSGRPRARRRARRDGRAHRRRRDLPPVVTSGGGGSRTPYRCPGPVPPHPSPHPSITHPMTATLFGPAADVIHSPLFSKALGTLLRLVAATALQFLLRRFIDKHLQDDSDERRRWVVQARNAVVLLVLAGLLVIWGTQLRTLAISLIA